MRAFPSLQSSGAPSGSRRSPLAHPGWLAAVALALLLLTLSLSLQPLVRQKTRTWIDGLHGASGDFLDAHLSLFPLRYTVTHLRIRRRDSKLPDPIFYADRVTVDLRWASLLGGGHLVGRVAARGVKVVLEQPQPGGSIRLPSTTELVPLAAVAERIQIDNGEVLYAWVHEPGWPTLWLQHVDATLENVASRPGLVRGPMTLIASATVQRSGRAWVAVTANEFTVPLSFSGEARLDGFDPSEMNALSAQKRGLKLSPGSFSMRMTFRCKEGRLSGVVDPTLTSSHVESKDERLGSKFEALFGKISLTVSKPAPGTDPSGKIAVTDDLTDPKLQLGPVLEKVVENGFLLGLQEGVKRHYAGPPEKTADQADPAPAVLEAKP
jgi:Domain of Unknown Function (DUF748)